MKKLLEVFLHLIVVLVFFVKQNLVSNIKLVKIQRR